jgi:hypothetical protein
MWGLFVVIMAKKRTNELTLISARLSRLLIRSRRISETALNAKNLLYNNTEKYSISNLKTSVFHPEVYENLHLHEGFLRLTGQPKGGVLLSSNTKRN